MTIKAPIIEGPTTTIKVPPIIEGPTTTTIIDAPITVRQTDDDA
jgi:hypothetical protein